MSGLAMIGLVVSPTWAGVSAAMVKAELQQEDGWEGVGTVSRGGIDNIHGRHKELDGVDCLEATADTQLSAALLREIILDIPKNLEWSSADLSTSTVLFSESGRVDYYQVLNLPSPLADRYWFLRGTETRSDGVWTFSWERIDATSWPDEHAALLASAPNAVEIGINVGSWTLSEGEDGLTARFRSCTDVGGAIPRWAGEKAARLLLPNNIVDLFVEGQRRSL